ncbi:MAG: hypothetical protein ACLFV8_11455 [Alphaproteobacteria bacterium]
MLRGYGESGRRPSVWVLMLLLLALLGVSLVHERDPDGATDDGRPPPEPARNGIRTDGGT